MISVIIPALNEAETIASVVDFAVRHPKVSEVIVIDDGSLDGTPELAQAAGARVITSTMQGKGASMEDGMCAAQNEVLLYLDGDLTCLRHDLVSRMTGPILTGEADFVKARFSRQAGRVTTLTAKPLLKVFFPELAHLEQPLGGIIAARHSLLRKLRFESDYGVDIGLLLDAAAAGAHVVEVDIGHLEHDSHPLQNLGDMASQVVRTLLERAARFGRLHLNQVRETEEWESQTRAELSLALQRLGNPERLALFDMDGTLLRGRYVQSLARRTNKTADLGEFLDNPRYEPEERTGRIAALFAGVAREVFEETAVNMPLVPGAVETVLGLRRSGYRVGIVTDGYSIASEIVRRRVFADFSVANVLKFRRGKATGAVTLAPSMAHPHGCSHHRFCKVNVMRHMLEKLGLEAKHVLAVGDGENDVCMLRAAGSSFAYRPRTAAVQASADFVIFGPLTDVLETLNGDKAFPVSA